MQKLIVPELPSDDDSEKTMQDYTDKTENGVGFPDTWWYGFEFCRDEYAAKHREAAVIAVEALEKTANEDFRGNRSQGAVDAFNALEKIKKIYEQKGE